MINMTLSKIKTFSVLTVLLLSLTFAMVVPALTRSTNITIHYIVGEATYGSVPADGAVVTVINERTLEELSDVVGPSGNSGTSGWFLVDISEMPSGYREGDQLRIVGRGAGGYSGWYGINVSTVDNATVSQIMNVVLASDTSPPETTITGGPTGTINYNDVTFSWTGSDDTTPVEYLTFSYMLEGYETSWSTWSSSTTVSYEDLPNDAYTFKVKARDYANNTDPVAAWRAFTIEVTGSALYYIPDYHNFGGMLAGQTDSTTFELWNAGTGTLTYTLTESCTWVTVNPISGSSSGEHDTITISIDTTGLSEGEHSCSISLDSNGGSGSFTVQVDIGEDLIISYSPAHHDFGDMLTGQTDSTTFELWNAGTGTLTYTLTESCAWVTVNPISGSSSGEHDTITVTIDTTGLSEGMHTCNISIDSNGGNGFFTIEVNIILSDLVSPDIKNIQIFPFHPDAGKEVTISVAVTDNVAVADVFLNITYPDEGVHSFSIFQNKTGNTYYSQKTYTQLGMYNFTIYAIDTSNNKKTSTLYTFEVKDKTPPAISHIDTDPLIKGIGEHVNISAAVTDNIAVADVFLSITYPDETTENISISQNKTGTTYYCNKTYTHLGMHTFTIYAIDTSDNANTSDAYFFNTGDFTPPSITLVYPKEDENVSGTITIKWNATDNYFKKNTLKITLKYSTDGGELWHLISENQENDGKYTWNTTYLIDGHNYRLMIKANDSMNNEGSRISGIFTVDNTDPSMALQKPQIKYLYMFDREVMPILLSKAVIIGSITVTATATDTLSGVDKVEFYVDDTSKHIDPTSPYEWEWDERVFFQHTLTIVATDEAGNTITEEIDVSIYNI